MSRLVANHLVKRFDGVEAVASIDLAAAPGRVLAVLGRNASGKSTLLRLLAGVLEPTDGHVTLDGTPLGRVPRRVRATRLGYLAQQPELVGGFTLRESIAFAGHAVGGISPDVVEAAIARVGLDGLGERSFRDLSVGQRQRGGFARAMVQVGTDGVLVLDEPFAAQDPGEVHRLVRLVRELAAEGRAVVAAVHDAATAWSIADDVLLLEAGRVRFSGAAAAGLEPARLQKLFGVAFNPGPSGPMPDHGSVRTRDDGSRMRS